MLLSNLFRRKWKVPFSPLAKMGSFTTSPNSVSIPLSHFQKGANEYVKAWQKIAHLEGKRLAQNRILISGIWSSFEALVQACFNQELSNLNCWLSGKLATLKSEICQLSKELAKWQQDVAQRQLQAQLVQQGIEMELDAIRTAWEVEKSHLLEELEALKNALAQLIQVRLDFAAQSNCHPAISPYKSWLRLVAFALVFILIVVVDLPMAASVFTIFRLSIPETYVVVFGFAVTLPLFADFGAEVINSLKSKFTWWNAILLVFCLGLPISLCLEFGALRAEYLRLVGQQTGQDFSFASAYTLSLFNLFMFAAAVLASLFLKERKEEILLRRLFKEQQGLEKTISSVKETIAKGERKTLEEIKNIQKRQTLEPSKIEQEEKIIRDALANKQSLYNAFLQEERALKLVLINGCQAVIHRFRAVAFRYRRPNDPPQKWLDIPETPDQQVQASNTALDDKPDLKASSNGVYHASSSLIAVLVGLLLFCSGCIPGPEKVEPPVQIFVAFDGTDGKNFPPAEIDIASLSSIIPEGVGCTIDVGVLNNSSDILLSRRELSAFGAWENPFVVREAHKKFLITTERMLDSLHTLASKSSNTSSEIYLPLMKKIKQMAVKHPSSRSIIVISSDMLEFSAVANMYSERRPDALEAHFLAAVTPPDLRNFEIHILPPTEMNESDRSFSSEFWNSFFTKYGATVSWSLNLDLEPNLSNNLKK